MSNQDKDILEAVRQCGGIQDQPNAYQMHYIQHIVCNFIKEFHNTEQYEEVVNMGTYSILRSIASV